MRQRGFTLLETLVVIVLIAIIAGAVVLSAGSGSARRLENEAERLRELAELACDQATIESSFVGLGFAQASYGGFRFGASGWDRILQGVFAPHALPEGIALQRGELPLSADIPDEPQWICSPAGDAETLDLTVVSADGRWRVSQNDDGQWLAVSL